jgi:hypothetical protein
VRVRQNFLILLACLFLLSPAMAQSPNGTISGIVVDPSGAAIAGAEVLVVNDATGVQYLSKSNAEGIYLLPNLPPGVYRLQVSKVGFKTIIKPNITLNVLDALAINFTLPVGALSEIVTVTSGAPLVNTESAAVSTVVDRQFVENMPLNGRSFQTLITLTPGVVLTQTNADSLGQFSVNGQRTNANYFTVDGVSANFGINTGAGSALFQTAAGSTPALSAAGGTNTLVSIDAMQEFRIQTSSFAPEFGSTPGGQVAIVTRSGTNQFHGTLFEYFRNDVLDANDWFANRNGLPKPAERQSDFGGVFGGPIRKEKTFFFSSYEGLRLRQPLVAQTIVPDQASRQATPAPLQPFMNAFPLPNGPDLGNGMAQLNESYSNPSSLHAYSLRIDHVIDTHMVFFGRYNYAPSETVQRQTAQTLSDLQTNRVTTHTLTLGTTVNFGQKISNDFRGNYSNARASSSYALDSFGGAVPLPDGAAFPQGFSSANGRFQFFILGVGGYLIGKNEINEQRQVNVLDNVQVTTGNHHLKFGVDYRWLSPIASPPAYQQLAFFFGVTGPTGVLSGTAPFVGITANQGSALLVRNLSFYGQDSWRLGPRLMLTYGLRWVINPALRGKSSTTRPFTVEGLNDPATMTLAPRGKPLYETTYGNVAPRVGMAFQFQQRPGWESVLRAGFGIFYDLGTGSLGAVTSGFPFSANRFLFGVPYPLSSQQGAPPTITTNPPASVLYVADPHLLLPRSYQWNVAIEQALGTNQSVSATYVGAVGRELLRQDTLISPNPDFGTVSVTRNQATSDYHALQLKLQRRLAQGLQVLASYNFSHSLDISSDDFFLFNTPGSVADPGIDRGNSDFDVRHSATAAISYDVPSPVRNRAGRTLLGDWSVDTFLLARSGLPVDISGATFVTNGVRFVARPDLVPGQPFYLKGSQFPGGKAFNPAAFTSPAAGQQGDLGRNVLRGFGAWQVDFALRRQFHVTERIRLQFRGEFFNVFNHPNFGDPLRGSVFTSISNPLFGVSTQTLASSLGSGGASGGLNPLYQVGGPRSIQLALKLTF